MYCRMYVSYLSTTCDYDAKCKAFIEYRFQPKKAVTVHSNAFTQNCLCTKLVDHNILTGDSFYTPFLLRNWCLHNATCTPVSFYTQISLSLSLSLLIYNIFLGLVVVRALYKALIVVVCCGAVLVLWSPDSLTPCCLPQVLDLEPQKVDYGEDDRHVPSATCCWSLVGSDGGGRAIVKFWPHIAWIALAGLCRSSYNIAFDSANRIDKTYAFTQLKRKTGTVPIAIRKIQKICERIPS